MHTLATHGRFIAGGEPFGPLDEKYVLFSFVWPPHPTVTNIRKKQILQKRMTEALYFIYLSLRNVSGTCENLQIQHTPNPLAHPPDFIPFFSWHSSSV